MTTTLHALRRDPRVARLAQHLQQMRLGGDRVRLPGRGPRVMATACWSFPIYSQTFVYQELAELVRRGVRLRFLYAKLNPRDELPAPLARLWRVRRKMLLRPDICRAAYAHYRRLMPERIAVLIAHLSRASGLPPAAVESHRHFLQAFSFTRMVDAYRPDYLHSYFFYEGTLFTYVASYLLDVPRGVSCYADHMLTDYELKVVPLHLRQCALVIATSERIKGELIGLCPELDPARVLVKPNAVDVATFGPAQAAEPAPGEPYRLVCVSRIEPKKGLLHLAGALALLRDGGHRVELHVVGGVDDSEASRTYAAALDACLHRLGLAGAVHLHGRRTGAETRALLRTAHLFVAPFVETEAGDKDGIPTSLLEAMASGLPVVTTDAGSMTEVVTDGQDGVTVAQRDPAALAAAIAALLRDPERRAALGQSARRTLAARFDVSVCEPLFHARLQQVLAAARTRRPDPDPAPLAAPVDV